LELQWYVSFVGWLALVGWFNTRRYENMLSACLLSIHSSLTQISVLSSLLGFTSRAKWDADKLRKLLIETDYPDMICLQEARLKAFNRQERSRPMPSEYQAVKDAVEGIFEGYQPVWSLADTKYAGTLTLVHKRLTFDRSSSTAFCTESAIDLMLKHFEVTRTQVGLAESVSSSSTNKPKSPEKKAKQTSMKSFFAPQKTTTTNTTKHPSSTAKHHPEGRFQFFCFGTMDVLQTYVPNNGTKQESFKKRRDWDGQVLQFLKDRRKILQHVNLEQRPFLWCGDLNVAKEYTDGTHWQQREDGKIYEWWTDEAKCFVGGKADTGCDPKRPEDVGMPSFTPAERQRLREMLQTGDLVDVWRELHPNGAVTDPKPSSMWDRPNYTWRGHLGKTGGYAAKYQGKGQRLDYFLLSPSKLLESAESCEILGYGEQREGLFCGSDHCASLLKLRDHELK
jgi:exonuclease III